MLSVWSQNLSALHAGSIRTITGDQAFQDARLFSQIRFKYIILTLHLRPSKQPQHCWVGRCAICTHTEPSPGSGGHKASSSAGPHVGKKNYQKSNVVGWLECWKMHKIISLTTMQVIFFSFILLAMEGWHVKQLEGVKVLPGMVFLVTRSRPSNNWEWGINFLWFNKCICNLPTCGAYDCTERGLIEEFRPGCSPAQPQAAGVRLPETAFCAYDNAVQRKPVFKQTNTEASLHSKARAA